MNSPPGFFIDDSAARATEHPAGDAGDVDREFPVGSPVPAPAPGVLTVARNTSLADSIAESIAKTTPPSCAGLYPRERLFVLLDQCAPASAVWVCGPPGGGKSSLLASYLTARRQRALWYRVDEGDADLGSFFYYLSAAARGTMAFAKELPRFADEHRADPVAFGRRFFRELFSATGSAFSLVIDDLHKVDSEAFHAVLKSYIEEMPAKARVYISSRAEPGEGYARLAVNRNMLMIDGETLKLSQAETTAMAAMENRNLPEADLVALHTRSDGWAAGLMLMLQGAPPVGSNPHTGAEARDIGAGSAGDHQMVFRYFAEEVFGDMDERTRDFTLRTAWLPWMPDDAIAAFGPGARNILASLRARHYFTDREGGAYRYHDLFRGFLCEWSVRNLPAVSVTLMRTRAAAIAAQAGMLDAAMELFIAESRWREAGQLLQENAEALLAKGRHATLEAWFASFPPAELEERPVILYWLGICKVARQPERARPLFERAFAGYRCAQDSSGALRAWCAMTDLSISPLSNLADLKRYVQWLREYLPELPAAIPPDLKVRTASNMRGALMLCGMEYDGDHYWGNLADGHLAGVADVDMRVQIAESRMADHVFWAGNYAKAESIYHLLADVDATSRLAPLTRVRLAIARHAYHWSNADGGKGLAEVQQGIVIAASAGITSYRSLHAGQAFRYCMLLGQTADATAYLDEMAAAQAGAVTEDNLRYHICATWHLLENKEDARAHSHALAAFELAETTGGPCVPALARMALAQTSHAIGKSADALKLIDEAVEIAGACGSNCWLWNALMVKAWLSLQTTDAGLLSPVSPVSPAPLAYLADLAAAFSLGREHGFAYFNFCRVPLLQDLCGAALHHDIEAAYARRLISIFGLDAGDTGSALESWPWPVKIYTLRPFAIHRDGELLRFATKAQAKPVLLLKALVACGGERVSQAHLTHLLWPDTEGDRAHWVFRVTLRRLRQLLGCDKAVEASDGQITLNSALVWTDVRAFAAAREILERCLRDAQERGDDDEDRAQVDHAITLAFDEMLALYRSHFLGQESSHEEVFLPAREKLRSHLNRAIKDTARHWEQRGDWQRAEACYRKGLEADAICEDLYSGLMHAYQQQGLLADALKTYQRCLDVLRAVVNIEPGSKVQEMLVAIRAQQKRIAGMAAAGD